MHVNETTMRTLLPVLLLLAGATLNAQILPFPTGANRNDVSWHQFDTEHFTIIYHDGLDGVAREAANIAEAVYPVVTRNLRTEIAGRTPIYLSDLDEVQNAFAYDDRFIYIWMRGIVDDMPFGGVRASGHAKWLRAVITHEFTHTAIAHATGTLPGEILPLIDAFAVPRWFNEGTARFMEPDGWTTDLDMILRVAAVNGALRYDLLLDPDVIDGTLLYETGHSIVRYMTERFGDSTIARILELGRGPLGYDFDEGVERATGKTMGEIYGDWYRALTALYGAEYAVRRETEEIAPAAARQFDAVTGVRYSPDRTRIAILGGDLGVFPESRGQRLYLMNNDSVGATRKLSDEPGIDPSFSWSPDRRRIVLSKLRRGGHRELLRDLYILDVERESLDRLTTDARLTDPAWSPDGSRIVAVEKKIGRDNLVIADAATGVVTRLTALTGDHQIYTPVWSPDGSRIAFSLFDSAGVRAIAVVNADGTGFRKLVADTSNHRYPLWSSDGRRIAFTTHESGIPNLAIMNADGSGRRLLTDIAGGIYGVQWLPGSDSIVAISLDSRRSVRPHLISADQQATGSRSALTPDPPILPKYNAWRKVSFKHQVPSADSIERARTTEVEGYSSLAHIFPVVPFLPEISPDRDRFGATEGSRVGLATVWADPMVKHIIYGTVDYGLVSRKWGGELYYINNNLPVSLSLHWRNTLSRERFIQDRAYFQRNKEYGVEASYNLPAPNSLSIAHNFWLGGGYRGLQQWTLAREPHEDFDAIWDSAGAEGPGPLRDFVDLLELNAGYRFTSSTLLLQGEYTHSFQMFDKFGGYDKVAAIASARFPLFGSQNYAILLRAEGAAQWGEQLPQEPIALEDFQRISQRWLGLLDVMRGRTNYSVRGGREVIYGDRVLVGSIGLQSRLVFLERYLPILTMFRPQTVIFAESGSAWYERDGGIGKARFTTGYGAELRTMALPRLWVSFGVATTIDRAIGDIDPYIRLTLGL